MSAGDLPRRTPGAAAPRRDVWLALCLDPDAELFETVGMVTTRGGAADAAERQAATTDYPVDGWREVLPHPDQPFRTAYESHPQNGLHYRIECHSVRAA
jgi:hypothetical protein